MIEFLKNQPDSNTESKPSFEVKRKLKTIKERCQAAEEFINSLSKKPVLWKISGSTEQGNFRENSDLDIDALYEKEDDIPYNEIFARLDKDNNLIDGYIDFHYFAKDWAVYQHDPDLLKRFEEDLRKKNN